MNQFESNTVNLYGNKGREWLSNLPSLVKKIAEIWHLSDLKEVENLSYNYVLSGFRKKKPIILKIGFDIEGLKREVLALKAFNGYGAAKVLESMNGALLLKRLIPGTSLINYFPERDDIAVQIVCEVMERLYRAPFPTENKFPTIHNWLTALDRGAGVPMPYLIKARIMRDKLLKTLGELKLLHGDLHHYNILSNDETFMVIDPKGVIGEEAYEVAAFIRNPIPNLLNLKDPHCLIRGRIEKMANLLQLSPERIKEWCFVQGVLSWIWHLEDGLDPTYFKCFTKILEDEITPNQARD